MFTLAIGTVPSSNVLSQGPLPRRGIAAAWPGALVRLLPHVLAVVGVHIALPRRGKGAACPGALVRLLPHVLAVVGVHALMRGESHTTTRCDRATRRPPGSFT